MSIVNADILLKRPDFKLDIQCKINTQITGVFGPSGAGKTTFLQILAGLQNPDKGNISIQNREVFNSLNNVNTAPEKRKIGYVFQEGRLFPHLNVIQNLKYGIKRNPAHRLIEEVASLLKIADILNKKISQISGGQAQRVAIGRALLSSPEILILDEPFSSLDKNLRLHIILLLKPLMQKFNIPMLVVSHDLADLLMLTDQLIIIRDGKCAGIGNYYDLIADKKAFGQMNNSGLINVIEMDLEKVDIDRGLLILSQNKHRVYAESSHSDGYLQDEKKLSIILRPEDITLASHKIDDISILNQIEGKIEKLIQVDNKILCVVNHGFKLIAEVTLATKQKMKLKEGDNIWSLFKAAAIKNSVTV